MEYGGQITGYWGQLPLIQFIDNIATRSYPIVMPRSARIVIPDIPHHITLRGNYRQQVFFSDEDRLVYFRLLREMAERFEGTGGKRGQSPILDRRPLA